MRFSLFAGLLFYVLSSGPATSSAQIIDTDSESADLPPVLVQGQERQNENRQYDWAKQNANARIAYVSSGPRSAAGRMIDDDAQTAFRFSGDDSAPIVIVELSQSQELHRITAVFTPEVTRIDVYLLTGLPKDPSDLGYLKPFTSITEPSADGVANVDFAPSNARFVALRWTRKKTGHPFEVAQVSAFSFIPSGGIAESVFPADGSTGGITVPPPIVAVSPL